MRRLFDVYLKPSEVANILKVCQKTVLNMIEDGKLKAIIVADRGKTHYRILATELDRYVAEEYERCNEMKKKVKKVINDPKL